MKIKNLVQILVVVLFFVSAKMQAEDGDAIVMNQAKMEQVLRDFSDSNTGGNGMLKFTLDGVEMLCISDVRADRMRIVAPVYDYKDVTEEQKDLMMIANFHTALDARYAVSNDILYAVFIHGLSSLSEAQIRAGARQTATLAITFGTSYHSGELTFGGGNHINQNDKGTKQTEL